MAKLVMDINPGANARRLVRHATGRFFTDADVIRVSFADVVMGPSVCTELGPCGLGVRWGRVSSGSLNDYTTDCPYATCVIRGAVYQAVGQPGPTINFGTTSSCATALSVFLYSVRFLTAGPNVGKLNVTVFRASAFDYLFDGLIEPCDLFNNGDGIVENSFTAAGCSVRSLDGSGVTAFAHSGHAILSLVC